MKEILNIPLYGIDLLKYKTIYNSTFWYKKHKGLNWIKGQNFGDYLSLVIVGEIARREKLKITKKPKKRLLAVGSILHFARDGDVIWGAGVNGKISSSKHTFNNLDIRMVRGPLTKEYLENKGMRVDNIFGDPVLLLPILFPELKWKPIVGKIIVIPNLNEFEICRKFMPSGFTIVSPLNYWRTVVSEILTSELVLTSSLHGLVVSEAFGVPVRFVMPKGGETIFKYQDYYNGTGRNLTEQPSTFDEGINLQSGVKMPNPIFDINVMIDVFPRDLFNMGMQ